MIAGVFLTILTTADGGVCFCHSLDTCGLTFCLNTSKGSTMNIIQSMWSNQTMSINHSDRHDHALGPHNLHCTVRRESDGESRLKSAKTPKRCSRSHYDRNNSAGSTLASTCFSNRLSVINRTESYCCTAKFLILLDHQYVYPLYAALTDFVRHLKVRS